MHGKIVTDIEQSKVLAEILPLESADLYYKYVLPKSDRIIHVPEIGNPISSLKRYNEGYTFGGKKEPITLNEFCIPCWSLGALLELLPDKIQVDNENYYLNLYKTRVEYRGPMTCDGQKCTTFGGASLIDAIFEAISFLLVDGKIM